MSLGQLIRGPESLSSHTKVSYLHVIVLLWDYLCQWETHDELYFLVFCLTCINVYDKFKEIRRTTICHMYCVRLFTRYTHYLGRLWVWLFSKLRIVLIGFDLLACLWLTNRIESSHVSLVACVCYFSSSSAQANILCLSKCKHTGQKQVYQGSLRKREFIIATLS